MTTYSEPNDWTNDRHNNRDEVHYRLYLSPRDHKATTICVQWFDYYGHDARRILSPEAWDTETEALTALGAMLPLMTEIDRGLGQMLADQQRDITLAAMIRVAVTAQAAVSDQSHSLPEVDYLHLVLDDTEIDWIRNGGQVRVDVDPKDGSGPKVRVAVVFKPKAVYDTSYYK